MTREGSPGLIEICGSNVQITCFSDETDGTVLHFQIIHLSKQEGWWTCGFSIGHPRSWRELWRTIEIRIYVWIGFNSARFGYMYAAAPTKPNNTASVTPLLGGASDNIGSGIARRLVLKLGLNVILACNIPKNHPIVEAQAEKLLIRKLIDLGYTKPKSESLLLQ